MDNLNDTEKEILKLRMKEGLTIDQTIHKLKISRKDFKEIVKKLKKENLYDEEEIKKAMKRRKRKEYTSAHKSKQKLSPEEENYRKKCIEFLCTRYFSYNETHRFNPVLVTKLQQLHSISSYKIIFNTIIYQKKNLDYANRKPMASEFQKISYMMAIIRNNLHIVYKKIKRKENIEESKEKKSNTSNLANQLNKTIISKPTDKIDMSQFLDD